MSAVNGRLTALERRLWAEPLGVFVLDDGSRVRRTKDMPDAMNIWFGWDSRTLPDGRTIVDWEPPKKQRQKEPGFLDLEIPDVFGDEWARSVYQGVVD